MLLCAFHHIIFDGWSVAIFSRDLSALYEAFRRGEDNPLKALPSSMPTMRSGSASAWKARVERQLAYWKSQLADAPALDCPPTCRVRCGRALPGRVIRCFGSGEPSGSRSSAARRMPPFS